MKRFEAIQEAIGERWGSDPAAAVCRAILEFAVSKPTEESVMLTFGDFLNVAGADYQREELQRALAILVSRFHALELKLVFFDEDEGPIYLDKEEQRAFLETGKLIHPHEGEEVQHGAEKTFPYYVAHPRALLEEVVA